MPLRPSAFDPSGSRAPRLSVQIPADEAAARPELIKCPELLLTGLELEKRTPLRILHKKGRRFESPWEPFFVGVYAHALFYYANLGDWPLAVVPLADADVKAVDRIFRHGDAASGGDDCGPCWKVTSSAGRVLLFRAPSHEARVEWIEQLRQAAGKNAAPKNGMDGKAALALARRLSRSSSSASSTSASSTAILQSPRTRTASPQEQQSRRRKRTSGSEDDSEMSEMLRDALRVVEKQRKEIKELQARLEKFEAANKETEEQDRDTPHSESQATASDLGQRENVDGEMNKQSDEDQKELDLDAMLDDAAIEICKMSRSSAISDVLSEDEDTPESEDENDRDEAVDNADKAMEKENLTLVNELRDASKQIASDVNVKSESEAMDKDISTTVVQETERTPSFPKTESTSAVSPTSPESITMINCYDTAENEAIQQQAAELAEMARNLNKDDLTDSSSTRESSEDGSLTSSCKGSHSGAGIFDSSGSDGNDFLQQQAMELAEIARNLQSSFRVDPKPAKVR
ncbi:unnamed protein product [Phytophthora lilii]|uniref:Unnamed protein product n=1 Tax=Phytophthora lilii TaxID=2077276 RepID=A0A9W6TMC0_9STRA|nr:unnamed protein product [Phytophthora lilii]